MSHWNLAVVVPARDEAAVLPRCLSSIDRATSRVRDAADTVVIVVADACFDDTEAVAARCLGGTRAAIVRSDRGNVGAARHAGIDAALAICGPGAADRLWIAMTDADTVVPPHWLRHQLRAASAGWHALVGGVAIGDRADRWPGVDDALADHHRAQRHAGVAAVHGANLGMLAASVLAVGGMPELALAEDAALVTRLEHAGCPVLQAPDMVVFTSARRDGRARGGFATFLDGLETRAAV